MHALACLALALAATPAVDVPLGGRTLALEPPRGADLRRQRAVVARLAHARGWRARGARRGPEWEATVRLAPAQGGARSVEIALRWTRRAALERAALVLGWRGAPRALGRDLEFARLAAPLRTGRGTPLLVAAGAAVLAGGPGVVAARAAPEPGGVEVALLLDDADERPFSTYAPLRHAGAGRSRRGARGARLGRRVAPAHLDRPRAVHELRGAVGARRRHRGSVRRARPPRRRRHPLDLGRGRRRRPGWHTHREPARRRSGRGPSRGLPAAAGPAPLGVPLVDVPRDFNDGAQRFYEREGWVRVGALRGLVLPDVAEVLYWKRLR